MGSEARGPVTVNLTVREVLQRDQIQTLQIVDLEEHRIQKHKIC